MATLFEGLIAREAYSLRANVRVATTTDLDNVGNGTWATGTETLTAGTAGATTIDGVVLADGDRVLVKNQGGTAANIENGIYEVSDAASGSPTVFTRTSDLEAGVPATGSFVFMMEGTANAQTGWICVNEIASDVVDTDDLEFKQFDVISTLSVSRGGTGATSFTNNEIVLGQGTNPLTTITSAANSILVTNASGVPSFSTTLPNGLTATFDDENFTIVDDGDNTKQLQFEVSTAPTGTLVELTIPPASTTIVGTDSTQTLTNKFIDSATYDELLDVNDNEMIVFTATTSAVNHFNFTNAATGGKPTITAAGDDANVGLGFQAKGTGTYCFFGTGDVPAEIRLYEDTDNGSNYVGLDVPSAITANLTFTLPGTDGSSGDVIQTDGSGNLSFVTPSSGRVAYHLVAQEIRANRPNYVSVGYFAWDQSRYSSYTSGALVFEVDVGNRNLDIRLQDTTANATVVEQLAVSADGHYTITGFSNPSADARLELQVRKTSNGGQSPRIYGVQLEFVPS